MCDIHSILPAFSTAPYSNLLPSLERARVSTADLISRDSLDIAKNAQLPASQLRRLADHILRELQSQLGLPASTDELPTTCTLLSCPATALLSTCKPIGTLDPGLDEALRGGFPTGFLSEITGESGAGKTNLLLSLLISVQLPPPHGLARNALYISTEAALRTTRLEQMLSALPLLSSHATEDLNSFSPSLSRILSIQTPDLESQDHILRYQLPVAIKRHNIGIVVIDSITANFRAEFERRGGGRVKEGAAAMAKRSALLVEMGALLKEIARREQVAVVVANQVADRFRHVVTSDPATAAPSQTPSAPSSSGNASASTTSNASQSARTEHVAADGDPFTLDYQQRWFTGWGDEHAGYDPPSANLKTPSMGLVWANQIDARIALIKRRRRGPGPLPLLDQQGPRRFLKVVFAPWARDNAGEKGTEFVIETRGLRSVDS